MKNFKIHLVILFIISMQHMFATDYYVSLNGEGDLQGGSPENAAPFSGLASYLSGYRVNSTDPNTLQLNVYLASGKYTMPAATFFRFNTTASNVQKLHVTFSPYGTDSVIINGTGSTRFLALTGGSNAENAMNVTIDNIHLRNFHSEINLADGAGSLFTLGAYNTLDLNSSTIQGVSSRNIPFVKMAAYATINVTNCKITDIMVKTADNPLIITSGVYNTFAFYNSELVNWQTQNSGNTTNMFRMTTANSLLIIKNSKIKNCNTGRCIIILETPTSIIELENSIFRDNTVRSGSIILSAVNFSRFDITDCSFTDNQGNGSALFYFPASGQEMVIEGSTFSGNTGINNIIDCAGFNLTVYNNTFSGNSGSAIYYTSSQKSVFLNNTFYQSGDINNSYASNLTIRNNLFLSGGINNTAGDNISSNIIDEVFYMDHYSPGIPIEPIQNYVNHTLTEYEPDRPKVHSLLFTNDENPVLKKGGDMSITEYKDLLVYDQRGKIRPKLVSIGSCDIQGFAIKENRYTILYDPEVGLDPSYTIDLHDAILYYPDYLDLQQVQIEITAQPYNGELYRTSNNLIMDFVPKTNPVRPSEPAMGMVGIPFEVKLKISYDEIGGTRRTVEGVVFITIINTRNPMGIVDNHVVRCYGSMQPVDFESQFKYITGKVKQVNNKFYGFSIPLVGDLDGDGKPEVVALGLRDNETGWAVANVRYLYILNGQTGKVIVKYQLPVEWSQRAGGWHGPPSQLALVDSDRNGKAEIILATGFNDSNPNYLRHSKRLISYEVNEYTFAGSSDSTNTNKLSKKWTLNSDGTSDVRYDAYGSTNQNVIQSTSHFFRPLPQIVDIDGDGDAEIVAYNKIYDAKTGRFIMKFEDLAATKNASTAYVGQNRNATHGDDNDISFAFIYDVDQDGIYDIAAGGKLYYNISLANGTCDILRMEGIGDGHTAVADINADGIPEIIVSAMNNTRSSYSLKVWDPGLLKKDVQGNIVPDNRNPEVIAERSNITRNTTGNGNHSYIYIADIDGKKQNGKKFPEISVLSSHFFTTGTNATNVPVHPNVPNKAGELESTHRFSNNTSGAIYSFTWDDDAATPADRLKVSFLMEHDDSSINTGLTLFDFDNDGVQDICYRDEKTLRIISAAKSLVLLGETDSEIVRFKEDVFAYTGFEYPVIADIDGNASANLIVMGYDADKEYDFGYIYALESTTGQFAPAPTVWNQFMYSPLKINEDLTTPLRTFNPLDTAFRFRKNKDDADWFYPYNNTITQAVKSAVFEMENASGDTVRVLAPIVYTADAQILHTQVDRVAKKLRFYIKNNGDAALNAAVPVCLYRESIIPSGFIDRFNAGTDIFIGDSALIEYDLTDQHLSYDFITIRVSDATTASDSQDQFTTVYQDCNWADNVAEVGDFVLRNVSATVTQYQSAIIDVLANDSIPQGCSARLLAANITTPAGEGVLEGDFGVIEIIGNKIEYRAPATYAGGVVEITYKIECEQQSRSAKIFIYILESCYGNFTVCENTPYQACLKSHIEGVTYDWYNRQKEFMSNVPPDYDFLTEDKVLYVKPRMPEGNPYRMIDFPLGPVVISVMPAGQSLHTVRWTGIVDTDWNNPRNWVRIEQDIEYPVSWVPTNCVNVVLPKETAWYPALYNPSACANIKLEERTMIAGLHHLTYNQAQVNLSLTPNELDRFIMWSAPLQSMYTGDYHFSEDSPNAKRGDVFMNFFQSKNPDYPSGVATENVFTSTFASLDTELPLGQAFGLKVYRSDGLKPDFIFPKTALKYNYENNTSTKDLDRTWNGRFIVDTMYNASGEIDLPVNGDNDFRMIHIANPFMAYLNMSDFLAANSSVLEQSYKVWNGDINENFVSIIPPETKDQRIIIDFDQVASLSGALIPPLQSFFVIKKPGVNNVTQLVISDDMTTTIMADQTGGYDLLSQEQERNILRIRASQDKYTDMTVIYNHTEAKPEYDSGEDSRKLFNDNSRIAVYTFSASKIPLAINTNGNFAAAIPLGVKVKDNGMVTLNFTRLPGFGHKTVLTDHELQKSVDLTTTPSYSFMVDKTGDDIVEMNNRFTLSFTEDVSNEEIEENAVIVVSKNGVIHIRSLHQEMTGYQIYNLSGQLVTMHNKPGYTYQVEVPPLNFYVVKVNLNNGGFHTAKVYVDWQ